MDEYKLTVEDLIGKPIDKDAFEADTLRREPCYQEGSADKLSQFAVCPACDIWAFSITLCNPVLAAIKCVASSDASIIALK